jgi:hypothetical protein
MGVFGRNVTDAERAEELFSPYLDGQLSAEERAFLERYLSENREARAKFELLKRTVQLTRSLPPVRAPRSFVLPRSMARRPSLALRLYPAMRLATVAAMALFAFALVGDLATSSRLAAPQVAPSVMLSVAATAPAEVTALAAPAQMTPTALPTATPEPSELAALAAGTATPAAPAGATAPEGTPTTETQAEAPAPESAPPTEPPAADQQTAKAPEPTTAPTDEARLRLDGATADTSATQSLSPQPFDLLRVAVVGLAGLTLLLAATTLILRQRAR